MSTDPHLDPATGPAAPGVDVLARSRRAVVVSFAVALVLLLVVAAAAAAASYAIATEEVSDDAAQTATRLAESGVGPLLVAALRGEPVARAELDQVVAARLADGAVSQVTVWTPDGLVLYSSNRAIVGRRAISDRPYRTAIAQGVATEIDQTDHEFGDVPRDQRVVEVHVPIPATGNRLVLELHYTTGEYDHQTLVIALPLLALAVLPLLLLQATQAPVMLGLLRRVRGYERDRTEMAEYALTASERERRDIAAGVHDTVVQDLAGASYALSALERGVDDSRREVAHTAICTVRTSVESLRGLLVELYPATLTATALPTAIENLLDGVRRDGIAVTATIDVPADTDDGVAVVLYRVAREALANVSAHAHASVVELSLRADDQHPRLLRMRLADDGVGLPVDGTTFRGLALLGERLADLDGTIRATSGPHGGAEITVDVPRSTRDVTPAVVDG